FGAEEVHKYLIKPLVRASAVTELPEEPEAEEFPPWWDEPESEEPAPAAPVRPEHGAMYVNPWLFAGVALFLGLVLHVPPFRRAWVCALRHPCLGIRGVLWDLPAAFFRLALVRAFFQSKPYLLFYHFAAKPVALGLPVVLLLRLSRVPWGWTLGVWAAL